MRSNAIKCGISIKILYIYLFCNCHISFINPILAINTENLIYVKKITASMIFNIFSMVIVLILQKKSTNNVSLGAVQKLSRTKTGV